MKKMMMFATLAVMCSGLTAQAATECRMFAESAENKWDREFYRGTVDTERLLLVSDQQAYTINVPSGRPVDSYANNGQTVVSLADDGTASIRVGTYRYGKILVDSIAIGNVADGQLSLILPSKKIAIVCIDVK